MAAGATGLMRTYVSGRAGRRGGASVVRRWLGTSQPQQRQGRLQQRRLRRRGGGAIAAPAPSGNPILAAARTQHGTPATWQCADSRRWLGRIDCAWTWQRGMAGERRLPDRTPEGGVPRSGPYRGRRAVVCTAGWTASVVAVLRGACEVLLAAITATSQDAWTRPSRPWLKQRGTNARRALLRAAVRAGVSLLAGV